MRKDKTVVIMALTLLVILFVAMIVYSYMSRDKIEKFTPEEYILQNLKEDTTYLDYLKILTEAQNTSYQLIEESYYNFFIDKIRSGNLKIEDIRAEDAM